MRAGNAAGQSEVAVSKRDANLQSAQLDVLERLYATHYKTVLNYLRRRTNPEDAQDLVTETFLVAWKRIDRVPPHEAGWLCGIARNLLRNQQRSQRRRKSLIDRVAVLHPPQPTIEDLALGRDDQIVAALRHLPPSDQEVLMLRAWDGLSGAEAAAVLGCTSAVYNVRLFRARKRFRRMLNVLDQPEICQPVVKVASND